jgi:hypothetical protein
VSAIFSDCGMFRLRLDREIDPLLGGIVAALCGVNPSIAGAEANDQTIRKDIGFGRIHGWRRIIKINKFSHVATDVTELRKVADPVGHDNNRYIEEAIREADVFVPCWGPLAKLPLHLRGRWREVVAIAERVGKPMLCFGTAQDGQPRHTLMLAYSTPLVPWSPPTGGEANARG